MPVCAHRAVRADENAYGPRHCRSSGADVAYSRHLSRFLFVWTNSLPLVLYPLVGPTGTVPVSLVLGYFFLGIEDIGVRTEQPFDLLPLWQYVDGIDASCEQILAHRSEPEPWTRVKGAVAASR